MGLIANAGPLIALARIDRLELLPAAYADILVPAAVYREVTRDPLVPGAREVAEAQWLRSVEVTDTQAVARMRFWLDQGESEAIVLAQASASRHRCTTAPGDWREKRRRRGAGLRDDTLADLPRPR